MPADKPRNATPTLLETFPYRLADTPDDALHGAYQTFTRAGDAVIRFWVNGALRETYTARRPAIGYPRLPLRWTFTNVAIHRSFNAALRVAAGYRPAARTTEEDAAAVGLLWHNGVAHPGGPVITPAEADVLERAIHHSAFAVVDVFELRQTLRLLHQLPKWELPEALEALPDKADPRRILESVILGQHPLIAVANRTGT